MNGMTYEKIKTIILTVLVLTSIVLTGALWTYQPKYDFMENVDSDYIQNVSVSSNTQVDAGIIIRPSKILIHKDGKHYGIVQETEMNKLMKQVKKWSFDEFENISSTISKKDFLSFLHGKGKIEIIYPDDFPIEMYHYIFKIEDEGIQGVNFDRIVIPVEKEKEGIVYFVCMKDRKIYKATVNNFSLQEIQNTYYYQAEKYPRYFVYDIDVTKSLFIPEGPITMNRLQYYTDELDPDKFKQALFSNPSFVKQDLLTNGEEYTDGSSLMKINSTHKILSYVNPAAQRTLIQGQDPFLIQKSIDFVNEHGGWTDTYHFAEWDEKKRKVVFRLVKNSYPVFNAFGMSEVVPEWGDSEIINYSRPIFRLEIADRTNVSVQLPSGREVVKQLKDMRWFEKKELVYDIVLGYELIRDSQRDKIVVLEPAWFCLYDGTWRKIVFKENEEIKRGDVIGLE
jgi:regulatory protein YycH of two-component signal transduction system YycFG